MAVAVESMEEVCLSPWHLDGETEMNSPTGGFDKLQPIGARF